MSATHPFGSGSGNTETGASDARQAYLRQVVEDAATRKHSGWIALRAGEESAPVHGVSLCRAAERLVLVGAPGTGKTAILREASAELALDVLAGLVEGLPLYLDLGRARPGEGVDELVGRVLRAQGLNPAEHEPTMLLLDHLELATDVYLMDGLEMLLKAGGRAGPAVVMACRSGEWGSYSSWFADVQTAAVLPLTSADMERAAGTALEDSAATHLTRWLAHDAELAAAVRRPQAAAALLTVASRGDAPWRRCDVLDALLDAALAAVPSTERPAYRAALSDVALSAHGRAFIDGVDTMAMGLGVTRDAMIRTGAVVAHGPSLEFVEPLLAVHCAAVALASRFGHQPRALIARLGGATSPGAVSVLIQLHEMSDDVGAFEAALRALPGGEDIVALCRQRAANAALESVDAPRDTEQADSEQANPTQIHPAPQNAEQAVGDRVGGDISDSDSAHSDPSVEELPEPADAYEGVPSAVAPVTGDLDALPPETWFVDPIEVPAPEVASHTPAERFAAGEAWAEAGDLGAAALAMTAAINEAEDVPSEWLDLLGQVELERGRPEVALPLLERAHGVHGMDAAEAATHTHAAGLRRLARAQLGLGHAEDAAALLSRAVGMAGDDAGVLADLARARAAAGHLAAAVDAMRAAIALDDLWPDDRALLGRLETSLAAPNEVDPTPIGDAEPDALDLAPIRDVDPDVVGEGPMRDDPHATEEPATTDGSPERDPAARPRAGHIDVLPASIGEHDGEGESAQNMESGAEAAPGIVAQSDAESGADSETAAGSPVGTEAGAVAAAKSADDLESDRGAEAGYEPSSEASAETGSEAGVEQAAAEAPLRPSDQAMEPDPSGVGIAAAMSQVARLYAESGELEAALHAYGRAAEAVPDDPAPHRFAGDIARRLGRVELAISHLGQAALLGDGDVASLQSLAEALHEAGRDEEAEAALTEALDIAPDETSCRCALSALQAAGGRHEDALATMAPAVARAPRDAALQAILGDLALGAGDRSAARAAYEQAVASSPGDEALTMRLAELVSDEEPRRALALLDGLSGVEVLRHRARIQGAIGDWNRSALSWQEAAENGDDDPASLVAHAEALCRADRARDAVTLLEGAQHAAAGVLPAATSAVLAHALQRAGRERDALVAFGTAVERDGLDDEGLLAYSKLALQLGAFDEAISAAQRAAALRPGAVEPALALAKAYESNGLTESALRALRAAVHAAPDRSDLRLRQAQLEQAMARPEAAVATLEAALSACPASAALHGALGEALADAGRRDEAIEQLQRATQLEPERARWALALARAVRAHDPERAVALLRHAVRLAPSEAEPHVMLGVLLAEQRIDPAALAVLERATELAPRDGIVAHRLGEVRLRLGDAEGAIRALRRAGELDPKSAIVWASLAEAQRRAGRLPAAEDSLGRAVVLAPQEASHAFRLGRLRLERDDVSGALDSLRRGVGMDGEDASGRLDLGLALERSARYADAVPHFAAALRLNESSADASAGLGRCRLAAGEADAARGALEHALRIGTPPKGTLEHLAEACAAAGDGESALTHAATAVRADRESLRARLALARAHVVLGDAFAAREALAEASLLATDDPILLRLRAELSATVGDPETARDAGMEWLDAAPEDARAALAIAERAAASGWEHPMTSVTLAPARAIGDEAVALDALRRAMADGRVTGAEAAQAARTMAIVLGRAGDHDAARAAADEAVAAEAHDARNFVTQAWTALLDGEGETALAATRLARARGGDDVALHVLAGRAHLTLGQADLAVAAFRLACERDADNGELRVLLGTALQAAGLEDEARAQVQRAGEAQLDPDTRREAGRRALADGDDEQARLLLEPMRTSAPRDAEAMALLAEARLASGDLDGSIAAMERATQLAPEHAAWHATLAEALATRGDHEAALERYRRATRLAPTEPDLAIAEARTALRCGDQVGARDALEGLLRLEPKHSQGQAMLARLALADGRTEEARERLAAAVASAPAEAGLHRELGLVAKSVGDMDGARGALEAAAELDPSSTETFLALGDLYITDGEVDDAIQAFEQAVASAPDTVDAHLRLGNVCREAGMVERALTVLRRASEVAPNDARPRHQLGRTLAGAGRLKQAVAAYDDALQVGDSLPELYFDAGDAWWRLHEYERAKELLEQAHKLRPTLETSGKLAAINAIRFVGRFVPAAMMAGAGPVEDAPRQGDGR